MPKNGSVLQRLRGFDAYSKTLDEFRVKTLSGATVTIVSAIIILILVLSEFQNYRTVSFKPELGIDTSRKGKMTVNFNITFPRIPCYALSLDVMDASGEHQENYDHHVYKVRLDPEGRPIVAEKQNELGDNTKNIPKNQQEDYCGSCYGGVEPESGCCNTCSDVRMAYMRKGWSFVPDEVEQCIAEGWKEKIEQQSKEGCNLHGNLILNKVPGNFHIAPGESFQNSHVHVHDMQSVITPGAKFDLSHIIHELNFGRGVSSEIVQPLEGVSKSAKNFGYMYQYFLKVVSTDFVFLNKTKHRTNQYSVTQNERELAGHMGHGGLPGVFFNYEISPMLITYKETRGSFVQFFTGVCAIVGGIFTVAGLVDGFIYQAERRIKKKMELGKAL
ncbi:uncharacterized protein VTP21DRAFT_672 [Calcarisporiella thermophila]|uniref:uncharacterized protein n=1 Tax=Calcarisporiella thermophila TaxID=911321 RepID=UPI003743FBE7